MDLALAFYVIVGIVSIIGSCVLIVGLLLQLSDVFTDEVLSIIQAGQRHMPSREAIAVSSSIIAALGGGLIGHGLGRILDLPVLEWSPALLEVGLAVVIMMGASIGLSYMVGNRASLVIPLRLKDLEALPDRSERSGVLKDIDEEVEKLRRPGSRKFKWVMGIAFLMAVAGCPLWGETNFFWMVGLVSGFPLATIFLRSIVRPLQRERQLRRLERWRNETLAIAPPPRLGRVSSLVSRRRSRPRAPQGNSSRSACRV